MSDINTFAEDKRMRMFKSMGFKFIIFIILIISIAGVSSTAYIYQHQSKLLVHDLEGKVKSLGRYISIVIPEDILAYDFEALNNYMRDISRDKDIVYGVVSANDDKPMTSYLNMDDPFILKAFKNYDGGDIKKLIKIIDQGKDVFIKEFPVKFNNKRYATLKLGYTTNNINQIASDISKKQIIYTVLVILTLIFTLYYVFVVQVLRPGKIFLAAFKSLGDGEVDKKLFIHTNNEFNTLSTSFNKMTDKINAAMEELIEAKEISENASKAKSDFLSRMSHELRTPLNAILGFSQLISIDDITPKQKDYIKEVLRAGDHLLCLINEILDIASVERGDISIYPAPESLDKIINESWSMLATDAVERDIELIKDESAPANNIKVFVDKLRTKQVLINLLSNAIKYNHVHGKIWLNCKMLDNHNIELAIRDNGIGITEEDMSVIFKPFERGNVTFHSANGAGIGLSLCKTLVEKMGGSLSVESTKGIGSTFMVEFPVADDKVSDIKVHSESEIKDSYNPEKFSDKRVVLYVEDNTQNWMFLKRLFERWPNVELIIAVTGNEGVELAKKYIPDLILLDIQLPDIDGYEVLKQLRIDQLTREIPVVAVSANAMRQNIENMEKTGFVNYITKPLKIDDLIAIVEKILWDKK